jgi:hypothetical protein
MGAAYQAPDHVRAVESTTGSSSSARPAEMFASALNDR